MEYDDNKVSKKRIAKTESIDDLLYLLTDNRQIDIPITSEGKESLLNDMKVSLIDIDCLINRLTEKRNSYLGIISVIEEELKNRNDNIQITKYIHQKEITMMNDNHTIIDNYEDFNDLDNCQGFVEYNGNEEEDDIISSQQECDMINIHQHEDNDNCAYKSQNILRKSTIDNKRLSKIKEKEEDVLEEKYQLFKKPIAKKKVKKKPSSKTINSLEWKSDIYDPCSFPDIESLDEEKLKDQCKIYGLKQSSNKAMKNQLKEIFIFLSTSKYEHIFIILFYRAITR